MTQHEIFRVDEKFGQGMAWETVHLPEVTVVDKPGGLDNAPPISALSRRCGSASCQRANRGEPAPDRPHKILPALAS